MSASFLKATLVGHMGNDPRLVVSGAGRKFCNLSVAVSRRDGAQWVKVVATDDLAEQCAERLHKGRQVFVEGRIRERRLHRKETTICEWYIAAENVQFLDGVVTVDSLPPLEEPSAEPKG